MTRTPFLAEFQVTVLPAYLTPNALYYVKAVGSVAVTMWVTDLNGVAFPIASDTAMLTLAQQARDSAIQAATYAENQANLAQQYANRPAVQSSMMSLALAPDTLQLPNISTAPNIPASSTTSLSMMSLDIAP